MDKNASSVGEIVAELPDHNITRKVLPHIWAFQATTSWMPRCEEVMGRIARSCACVQPLGDESTRTDVYDIAYCEIVVLSGTGAERFFLVSDFNVEEMPQGRGGVHRFIKDIMGEFGRPTW